MKLSGLNLNSTPPEIIRSVCEHLDASAWKTLRLVSRQTHLVASALLFETVYINVLSRKQLRLDVDHLTNQLRRSSCLDSVHLLRIDGSLPREGDDDGKLRHGPVPQWKEECRLKDLWHWPSRVGYDRDAQKILDEDHAWLPLAHLITILPALRDIVFACTNQFSPCLLEALHHTRSSRCRLHLETFCLRSLYRPDLQDFEYRLITSTYLEEIATEHYEDARIALALAPMLRCVYLFRNAPAASIEDFLEAPEGATSTTRLISFHNQKGIKRRCPLIKLQFCRQWFDEAWNELVDLSALRTFILDKPIEQSMISWLAAKAPFKSLTEFEVPIDCWDKQNSRDLYSDVFTSFIHSICPLRSLRIHANPFTSNIFTAILDQHGEFLRYLSLTSFGHLESLRFDACQVQEISSRCPSLRELVLRIPRSKGDRAEQAIYTALGSMSQLRHLRLRLDCQNRTCMRPLPDGDMEILNNHSWDEFSQQIFPDEGRGWELNPRNGHVMDMLINCALDAELAEEIFYCISSGKAPGAQRLESLQMSINGGGFFGEPNVHHPADACGVQEVISRIAKMWMLERGDMGKLEVREMDRGDDWNNGLEDQTWIRLNDRTQDVLTAQVEPVVRRLWPGSGNWLDEWHSFPLEGFKRDDSQN